MNFTKKFQLYTSEFNKNISKIVKVFFTIFVSLLIFSSVIILKNSIEGEISKNSRSLLGGDLEISTKNKDLDPDLLKKLSQDFFITKIIEFTVIVRNSNEENRTTRIRVVDNFYPLIGEVNVEPNNALSILQTEPNTILVDKTIRNDLNLDIGDEISIQETSLKIIGFIESLPDLSGFFLFGNQGLINEKTFRNLEINNLGNFISFKYKMIPKDTNFELKKNIFMDTNLTIKFPEDANQSLKKTIENFIFFLSIISASAILISGIGLTNSLFSFLSSNQLNIAIYKSLGLSSGNIKRLYYSQSLIILTICSLISYVLGVFIIFSFNNFFLSFIDIDLNIKFNIYECLTIQFFSLIIFFAFARPVFRSIDQVRVADLFRNSFTNLNLNYNKESVLEFFCCLLIFILSFSLLSVKPKETVIFFIVFFIIVTFFYYLSKLYILFLNKIKNINSLSIKMGIKNFNTYKSLNSIVIMTMGLGITILLFLGILSSNINNELSSSIPENAPNYFFLGIKKNEVDIFSNQIYEIDDKAEKKIVPIISARIERINNKDPKEIANEDNASFWFINGERRISWSKFVPTNNLIVKGKWWNLDEEDKLKLSLDSTVAKNLGLRIGDTITFNIYGNNVTGIISNFRNVDYKDLKINFAILFNPRFASNIPHEFMSTVKFNDEGTIILNNLLKKLPNITYIKVSEYIKKSKEFLNKMFFTSMFISSIVIVIGLIVLSNSVKVIGNLKLYQNLVLKILGLGTSSIIKSIIFETLTLFFPIIFFSLILATLSSYIFINNIFNLTWYFDLIVPIVISITFLFVLIVTLLISNRKYLNFNTYYLLKNN